MSKKKIFLILLFFSIIIFFFERVQATEITAENVTENVTENITENVTEIELTETQMFDKLVLALSNIFTMLLNIYYILGIFLAYIVCVLLYKLFKMFF